MRPSSWLGNLHTWQGDFSFVWCCEESIGTFCWSFNRFFGTTWSFAHSFHGGHAWSQKEDQTSLHHLPLHSAVGSCTRLSCLFGIHIKSYSWVRSQTWRNSWPCFACTYASRTRWVGRAARWNFSTWFGFWLTASHDPLDDDLVPECPPPDVFPEDVPDEDEDPVHGITSGMAVIAS